MIEAIFKKFDTDGSGGLDIGELVELFQQNDVMLDKETILQMFQAKEFTLDKFKAIIDTPEDLNRIKKILKEKKSDIIMARKTKIQN